MTSRVTPKGEEGTPGLQLHLVDSDDEPINEGAGGERRPSTASLSRFRSCPQLSTADGHLPDSPESDDLGLGPELLVTHVHFTHGSPRQQRPRREMTGAGREEPTAEGRVSQTPTPPSTPGSRRSHVSMKESLCAVGGSAGAGGGGGGGGGTGNGGGGGVGGGAPAVGGGARGASGSTPDGVAAAPGPRRVDRARLEHARLGLGLGRTASQDSPNAAADPALVLLRRQPPPLQDDVFQQSHHHHAYHLRAAGDQGSERGSRVMSEFYDEPPDISIEDRLTVTEDGASTPGGGERGPRCHGDPDSMDKCARWLQSLKMTSGDRLKSRSHIQLPPI